MAYKTEFHEFEDIIEEYTEVIFAMICGDIEVNSATIRELLIEYGSDLLELRDKNK